MITKLYQSIAKSLKAVKNCTVYRNLGGNGMLIQMDEDIRELEFKK